MSKREILERFVRELRDRYGDRIERIILFGSVARGEDRKDSDIDVLVITNDDSFRMQREISDVVLDILLDTGVYVSVKVLSLDEYDFLRRVKTSFYRTILEEGVTIASS